MKEFIGRGEKNFQGVIVMKLQSTGRLQYYLFIISVIFLLGWLFLDLADRLTFLPWIAMTRGYREYLFLSGVAIGLLSRLIRKS